MTLLDLSRVDRLAFVGSILLILLAIAFPVKETYVWRAGAEEWGKWDQQFVLTATEERRYAAPLPAVGPIGRGFLLDERQRTVTRGYREMHFKELPNFNRMALEVIFVILVGMGCAYVFRAK